MIIIKLLAELDLKKKRRIILISRNMLSIILAALEQDGY